MVRLSLEQGVSAAGEVREAGQLTVVEDHADLLIGETKLVEASGIGERI